MPLYLRCLVLLWLAGLPGTAAAADSTSNLARERSYTDQIEKYLVVGDAIRLEARGQKFLALDTRPEKSPARGAVILLHGRGVHPAWGFIDKLRMDLSNRDWHTLSIQLPVLAADTPVEKYGVTLPEAFERIDAAIDHLRKKGIQRIILLGHSSGAVTAASYLAERPAGTAHGVILLGLGSGIPPYESIKAFAGLRLPILDMAGSRDQPGVLAQFPERKAAAARLGHRHYRQAQVSGANHFYANHYNEMRTQVTGWLDALK
jgi:predicted esterase